MAEPRYPKKTDRRDAGLLLQLMEENRFPRIWGPDKNTRDLRQLLMHRHKLVGKRVEERKAPPGPVVWEGLRTLRGSRSHPGVLEHLHRQTNANVSYLTFKSRPLLIASFERKCLIFICARRIRNHFDMASISTWYGASNLPAA